MSKFMALINLIAAIFSILSFMGTGIFLIDHYKTVPALISAGAVFLMPCLALLFIVTARRFFSFFEVPSDNQPIVIEKSISFEFILMDGEIIRGTKISKLDEKTLCLSDTKGDKYVGIHHINEIYMISNGARSKMSIVSLMQTLGKVQ